MEKEFEVWKDIKDYEGFYQVSSWGNIKSLNRIVTKFYKNGSTRKQKVRERIIIPIPDKDGYLRLLLWKNCKSKYIYVHRIVAVHFVDNPNNLPQVNHLDELKDNNYYKNLQWSSSFDNINHGSGIERSIFSGSRPVIQYSLKGEFIKEYLSIIDTKNYGFTFQAVHKCCIGKASHHKNFLWKFKYGEIKNNKQYIKSINNK